MDSHNQEVHRNMTRRERLETAIAMGKPDRMPFSLWMHFPNHDRSPRRLAEMSLFYQRELDLDFVKYMPYGLFSCVDYGLSLKVFPGFYDAPVADAPLIVKPAEWDRVKPVSGCEGEYAVVLESQRLFLKEARDAPLLQTVFSPLTTALKLTTENILLEHIRNHPEKVRAALERITETTIQWAASLAGNGAAGVFMASQVSLRSQLTVEEHRAFVRPYDLAVLDALKGKTWFNIYHMHGKDPWFAEFKDYPVQAYNWHDRDDGPSHTEARKLIPGKCFCGGLAHLSTAHAGTDAEVRAQVGDAWKAAEGKGVIFTPGCVLNPKISLARLRLIADCVKATTA
jgi:uroporphyrinogen decarboxylase